MRLLQLYFINFIKMNECSFTKAIPNPAQKIKSIFDDDEEDDGADLFEDLLKSTKKAASEAKVIERQIIR